MRNSLLVFAFVCLTASVATFAQTSNARVSGSVLDSSGARLPGVTVTAENTRTGVALTTVSNDAGAYVFPSLQPGPYRFTADLPGFQKAVNNVVLEISAQIEVSFTLGVSGITQAVEVSAAMDSPLAATTSTVGGVLAGVKVRDLPLPARNVLDLVLTQSGVVGDNFAGSRIGSLNVSRDGVNVMDQRINGGVNSVIFTSADLVDEVRVVTSPADAELGRGSGQVQISTRSGGNEFHGSLFESHRNTVLNANTWFNNLRGNPRNFLIRNQFGGRLGGPIIKNKTFFHFLYDGQRQVTKNTTTATTFTATARQGDFRYFPGALNANFNSANRTVNEDGSPYRPSAATGNLESVNVFGRDSARLVADPTGTIARMLSVMPLPNNFRSGDGLNTAGYTWSRRATSDRDQYNVRIDHHFNENHRINFNWTRETTFSLNGFLASPYPDAPGGTTDEKTDFYSLNFTSTLAPTVVNEFHAGASRGRLRFYAPWELESGKKVLPTAANYPYLIDFVSANVTNPIDAGNDPQGRISPFYVWGDSLSWIRGEHSFKFGGEVRFSSTNGFNSFDVTPRANLGAGGAAVTGLTASVIPTLGQNEAGAQNLLLDLTGSITSMTQAFNASAGANPLFLAGEGKVRTWQQREFAWFFKDDWKVRRSLTLNLGVRYEWYGVPYEANGKAAGVVGGSKGLFGYSGTSYADMYQPGPQKAPLTQIELVGKNSPNPDRKLYNNDWNNFAPAVGLSWSIPYFGQNKTVLRAGYGIGYEKNSLRIVDVVAGDQPGLRTLRTYSQAQYFDLSRISLPLIPLGKPLETVPLDDRTQIVRAFDTNLRTPYIQNWNLTIQRELPGAISLDLRYVGNKGTKLWRGANLNEVNIFENDILNAFLAVQRGENSALLDRIFNGINLGQGAVDGSSIRAAEGLRSNSNTRAFFANNNVGAFASYLNNTTNFTNVRGGLIRNGGQYENWVVVNPQFGAGSGTNSGGANLTAAFANSTYHSMQLEMNKRFSNGWTLQSNYTWGKALGEEEGAGQEQLDSYRNLRDRSLDKRLLSFNRTHVFRNSGTFELPFGPGKLLFKDAPSAISRVIEKWQVGAIINLISGQPIGFSSNSSSFNQFTDNTPLFVGNLSKDFGKVERDSQGVVYFQGLRQVEDPSVRQLTTAQALNTRSTLLAVVDASGKLIVVNPTAGVLGNSDPRNLTGPGEVRFDVNLIKSIPFGENKEFVFRIDAIGALNRPNFGNPTTAINDTGFGRITSASDSRIVVLNARINF